MTLSEFMKMMGTIPELSGPKKVVYNSSIIPNAPVGKTEQLAPPYLRVFVENENTFAADGIVYYSSKQLTVILYTAKKDQALEAKVEAKLTEAGLFYTKGNDYFSSDQAYVAEYALAI